MNLLTMAAFCLLGTFELVRIPMEKDENVLMLLGPTDDSHRYVVLTDHLHMHAAEDSDTSVRLEVPLPAGVYDIEPPDVGGAISVIAIEGREVRRYRFREVGQSVKPDLLFELDAPYPTASISGLHILLVTYDNQKLLAIPEAESLKLYDLSGTLVRTVAAPAHVAPMPTISKHYEVGKEKNKWTVVVEPSAPMGWPLPDPLQAIGLGAMHLVPMSSRRIYVKGETALVIRTEVDQLTFAVPVAAENPDTKTVLRYRRARKIGASGFDNVQEQTAAVSFPGYLLSTEHQLPDFNGDGYGDLALWSFPEPVGSPDALLRALSSQSWPAKCSIHLFNPGVNRHEAKTSTRLDVRFGSMNLFPERAIVARDVNNDGCSDLAMSLARDSFSLWLWKKGKGFDSKPEFVACLPEPLKHIERSLPLRDGGTAMGLRTDNALFVLAYKPEP